MTSVFFQDRIKHGADANKRISLKVKSTNFSLFSSDQSFSPHVIELPRISLIIDSGNDSAGLRDNFNNLGLILQDNFMKLSDLLFYSPSLSGFSDCILVADTEYLVIPSLRSNLNLYHRAELTTETASQRRLKTLLSSLFFEASQMHDWNLIPKFSILSLSGKDCIIKRFPRFYSDSSNPSFFDQHIPKSSRRLRESTEQVRLLLGAYLRSESLQQLESLDLAYPRTLSSNFNDRCSHLREWLVKTHALAPANYDQLILYLLFSHRDFLDSLLGLYLSALSPQSVKDICLRNDILVDWYMQSLAAVLTPFLSRCISSICRKKMSIDDLEASNFELAVSGLMSL